MKKINDYAFGLGGVVPDGKDVFEVAIEKIMVYEKNLPTPPPTEIEPQIVETDDDNWYMTIKTYYGDYVVDNIVHHDPRGPENYITFTLSIKDDATN